MPPETDRPAQWRALGAEALAVAKQLTDPDARRVMLAIAEKYLELAERAEKRRSENGNSKPR
jgi:hypothetical protein